MSSSQEYDPFTTADFLNIPRPHDDFSTVWDGFKFDRDLENGLFCLPEDLGSGAQLQDLKLRTFQLVLEDVSIESLEPSSSSSSDTADDNVEVSAPSDDQLPISEEDFVDVWTLAEVKDVPQTRKLTSWDHFLKDDHVEPGSAYLSEAGARAFDAILATENAETPAKIISGDVFLNAMFELVLGRSSRYMFWNDEHQEFVPVLANISVSGYSPETLDELVSSLASIGSSVRRLCRPDQCCIPSTTNPSPGQLAFCATLTDCVTAVQEHLDTRRSGVGSLLQLNEACEIPKALLSTLEALVELVKSSTSDHDLLSSLFRTANDFAIEHPRFQKVLRELLATVTTPLLHTLSTELGLAVVNTGKVLQADEDMVSNWSSLLPSGLAQLINETKSSLTLLLENYPERLKTLQGATIARPRFDLETSWARISEVALAAEDFEAKVKSDLVTSSDVLDRQSSMEARYEVEHSSNDDRGMYEIISLEYTTSPLTQSTATKEIVLASLSRDSSQHDTFGASYDQALALSVSPMVSVQHRLLSYSALQVVFLQGNVRSHLNLQRQFQLFGDGLFAARVSLALFNSEQASGEGRRRTGATTGLRLQHRDTWPPASSELRLVLMGVLSECLPKSSARELGDSISFSLRDLPDNELERCRDVDSIYALDFLRMHYRAPTPTLESVISPESQEKYDRIFKHLLRLLRLKSVAQSLIWDICYRGSSSVSAVERRFRIEIQHFISTLADYSHNVAIGQTWNSFAKVIVTAEQRLSDRDYDGTLSVVQSLEHLKQLHEDALEGILRALFLKERQVKARGTVENIFGTILHYAASWKQSSALSEMDATTATKRHYDGFRRHRRRLIEVLQESDGVVGQFLAMLGPCD